MSRLASQTIDFPVGSNDLTIDGMAYNPASQLTSVNRSNDAYAWTASGNGATAYVPNGLNQYTSIAGAAPTYDSNGNMKTEPQSGKNYLYTSESLLDAVSGGGVPAATLTYDPLMRLYEDQANTSGAATQFVYDGTDMIAEYDQSNALQKRYVFGAGQPAPAQAGEPLVQLDAAGNRTWLSADERGSIIALSDDSGNVSAKNAYDEYGKPQPGNTGRFQYTGQAWIADLGTSPASGQGLYYYKSRMYAPHLGRFMQPDPIGYAGDGLNLYAYVLNDPINMTDPIGWSGEDEDAVIVNGHFPINLLAGASGVSGPILDFLIGRRSSPDKARIVVTGVRRALRSRGVTPGTANTIIQPYNSNFAVVVDVNALKGLGWQKKKSLHTDSSWELILPGTGYVLKLYLGDETANGLDTITITSPTASISHYLWVVPFELGYEINYVNTIHYCSKVRGC